MYCNNCLHRIIQAHLRHFFFHFILFDPICLAIERTALHIEHQLENFYDAIISWWDIAWNSNNHWLASRFIHLKYSFICKETAFFTIMWNFIDCRLQCSDHRKTFTIIGSLLWRLHVFSVVWLETCVFISFNFRTDLLLHMYFIVYLNR